MHGHREIHYAARIGWLRAAVLGANDGIVSTASLLAGVASAHAAHGEVLLAGVSGLVAGAMSMAAGEYVSVSSQADTERADLERETKELEADYDFELEELTNIYVERGLEKSLATEVAVQLMKHDALGAHARDELGLSEIHTARPMEAAFSSAGTFAVGALLPVLVAWASPPAYLVTSVMLSSLIFLALLGAIAARTGGANPRIGALRVTLWGAFAMGATALVGSLFGTVIS